jgi:hypothetical protein
MVQTIRTMGFQVQHGKIMPDPAKIDMLVKTATPTTKAELKAYLGLLQFYRDMLPHLAHTAHRLYAATSENFVFQWTDTLDKAFHLTKSMLQKQILNTSLTGVEDIEAFIDASKFAVCIVLIQRGSIISCASKVLNPSQRRWATIERELYAAAWGVKKLRFYLHGVVFKLFTDHKPLIGLFNKQGEAPNNRMMTMILSLMEYSFSPIYLPGVKNVLADFGTRYIDHEEWDTDTQSYPDNFDELMAFSTNLPPQLSELLQSELSEEHKQELRDGKFDFNIKEGYIIVIVQGEDRIWVPSENRRPVFWFFHKNLHQGTILLSADMRLHKLFWPKMAEDIDKYISQCVCAVKKNHKPHKYSEIKHIVASHPMQIVAIDLYFYANQLYFTAICIYTRFAWVRKVQDKQARTILKVYNEFCNELTTPEMLSCDNGGEFNLIETYKIPHPSEHPEANAVVERFHKELGKLSRILNQNPNEVVNRLNTEKAKLLMNQHLRSINQSQVPNTILFYETRRYYHNDLVWRAVPARKREKQADTFTGPHRILRQNGKFTYELTSHLDRTGTIHVNLNDIKSLHVPETKGWVLNPKYTNQLLQELGSQETQLNPVINFMSIGALVTDLVAGRDLRIKFFVIPEWPCMDWYKPLHQLVEAEAVRLPRNEDLFLIANSSKPKPLGTFAWEHWLFELR